MITIHCSREDESRNQQKGRPAGAGLRYNKFSYVSQLFKFVVSFGIFFLLLHQLIRNFCNLSCLQANIWVFRELVCLNFDVRLGHGVFDEEVSSLMSPQICFALFSFTVK